MISGEMVLRWRCILLAGMAVAIVLFLLVPIGAQPPGILCATDGTPAPPTVRRMPPGADTGVATISIEVRVPAEAPPGKEITYVIIAENVSGAKAHHVLVKATLSRSGRVIRQEPVAEVSAPEDAPPEKATVLAWKLGTLAPGERREVKAIVMPRGEDEISCCARVQFEHGQCVKTRIGKKGQLAPVPPVEDAPPVRTPAVPSLNDPLPKGPPPLDPPAKGPPPMVDRPVATEKAKEPQPEGRPALRLRVLAPKAMALNEVIPYKFEVANTGQGQARKVVLEVTPSTDLQYLTSKPTASGSVPLTWDLGDLAAGATRVIECDIASRKIGTLTTRAVVKAEGLTQEEEHGIVISKPKLALSLSGPARRAVGREAVYQITVRNVGDVPASDVEVTDEPIADKKVADVVTRVRATNGGRIESNVVRWDLGNIPTGGEKTVQVVLRSSQSGNFTYVCTARAKGDNLEQAQTTTEFISSAGLAIELDRTSAAQVKVGAEVTYILRVHNAVQKPDTNIDVVVAIPDGLQLIEAADPASRRAEVRYPKIARLEPGKSIDATLRLRALKPGIATLQVKAVSDTTTPDRAVRIEEAVRVEK